MKPIDRDLVATLRAEIDKAQEILCLSHVKPDGDAVGSLLGMGHLLRLLGKSPTLALQDPVPVEHRDLPDAMAVVTQEHAAYRDAVVNRRFDLIICLDASSPDRMGDTYNPDCHGQAPLVVIDHHVTNTRFGAVNWVGTDYAATAQMVTELADALALQPTPEMAECLLTGIVTDTLCFRTANTDASVLAAAMRLMQNGAELAKITQRTVNRTPFSMIKLWSLIFPSVQMAEGVIWASATPDVFAQAGQEPGEIGLSSFLVTVDEADMSAVFAEQIDAGGQHTVECSFRAKPGFDVAELAFALGGGGHPAAAGCTVAGILDEVIRRVIPAMQEARRKQVEQQVHGAS